jgi:pilus assembly protein CpaB
MIKIFRSRVFLGMLCILIAIGVAFFLAPGLTKATSETVSIVTVAVEIKKGDQIDADMLTTKTVGSYGLSGNVLTQEADAIGKYAVADMFPGDSLLASKLTKDPLGDYRYLDSLDGSRQAMSISIKNFSDGLSGKLEAGDIVTLLVSDYGDARKTLAPPELKYMYVLAVTNPNGFDKDQVSRDSAGQDSQSTLPSTITLLASPRQTQLLAEYETKSRVQIALVYRGDKENADKLLAEQDKYLAGAQ